MRKVKINDFFEELDVYDKEYTNEDLINTEKRLDELKSFFQEETKEKMKYNFLLARIFLGLVEVIDIVTIIELLLTESKSKTFILVIIIILNIFAGIILELTKDYK